MVVVDYIELVPEKFDASQEMTLCTQGWMDGWMDGILMRMVSLPFASAIDEDDNNNNKNIPINTTIIITALPLFPSSFD